MKTPFALILAAFLTVSTSAASAQSIACSTLSLAGVTPPPQTVISYPCTIYDNNTTLSQSTGTFSTAGPGQAPRIPYRMDITFNWDVASQLTTMYQVNVKNSVGQTVLQYAYGFGTYYGAAGDPQNSNPTQTVSVLVSGWPSEFKLELVQWQLGSGSTSYSWEVRLYNN